MIWNIYRDMVPSVNLRPMIQYIKDEYCKYHDSLVGCEIGVAEGENAVSILRSLPMKRLYLVDPYTCYDGDDGIDHNLVEEKAMKTLHKYKDKVFFIKKTSEYASDMIPGDLDFVYIDGNHSYEFVKNDIKCYYPLVKDGGIVGGHDFCGYYGVPFAVIEFVKKHKVLLFGEHMDWWVIKND